MPDENNLDTIENASNEGLIDREIDEPTDEEIGDVEDEPILLTEQGANDLNEVLNFFQEVLTNHEQAIAILAAAVFGGADESQLPDEGAPETAGSSSQVVSAGEGEVIPITTDISGKIIPE